VPRITYEEDLSAAEGRHLRALIGGIVGAIISDEDD
jgi:hypothetical protein